MRFRFFYPWLYAAFAAVIATAVGSPASAAGVTRIQQIDGTVHVYNDVRMRLAGSTLWITSSDRRGVLEIHSAACSFADKLQRCYPYALTLHQGGVTHPIAIHHGTLYVNLTDGQQQLPHSSKQLAPHGLLVLLETKRGTYISVNGNLDEVKQ